MPAIPVSGKPPFGLEFYSAPSYDQVPPDGMNANLPQRVWEEMRNAQCRLIPRHYSQLINV